MREITSKRNKKTQIITDEEWEWLVRTDRAKNFTVTVLHDIRIANAPKINKELLKPKKK